MFSFFFAPSQIPNFNLNANFRRFTEPRVLQVSTVLTHSMFYKTFRLETNKAECPSEFSRRRTQGDSQVFTWKKGSRNLSGHWMSWSFVCPKTTAAMPHVLWHVLSTTSIGEQYHVIFLDTQKLHSEVHFCLCYILQCTFHVQTWKK